MAVTGNSPGKQRGGSIGHRHGAANQAWSSGAVAAAVVFQTAEPMLQASDDTRM
jgi:hypothetical protein